MMQKNSKDNKIEIRDLGKIAVSEMLDQQRMSEKYERVGLRSIAEGKLALVLLAGGQGTRILYFLEQRQKVVMHVGRR